jgi:hypothetical protein
MCTPHAHTAPGPSSPRHASTLPHLRPKNLHFSCPGLAQPGHTVPCRTRADKTGPCLWPKIIALLVPANYLATPLPTPPCPAPDQSICTSRALDPPGNASPYPSVPCRTPDQNICIPHARAVASLTQLQTHLANPRLSLPCLRPKEKAPLRGSPNHKPLDASRQENCPSLTANRPKRGRHSQSPI